MASLPAVADHDVGDLVNLQGVLYELVANTEEANVYRGTAMAQPPITGTQAQTNIDFIWRMGSSGSGLSGRGTWAEASSGDRLPDGSSHSFPGGSANDVLYAGIPAGSTNVIFWTNGVRQNHQTPVSYTHSPSPRD